LFSNISQYKKIDIDLFFFSVQYINQMLEKMHDEHMNTNTEPKKEHADKITLTKALIFIRDFFHYIEDDTGKDFSIVFSIVDFFIKREFLTLKQIEIVEKMYFRFQLNNNSNINKFIDSVEDEFKKITLNQSEACKLFFNKYYINNDFSERKNKGRIELTKKKLYDINNKKF